MRLMKPVICLLWVLALVPSTSAYAQDNGYLAAGGIRRPHVETSPKEDRGYLPGGDAAGNDAQDANDQPNGTPETGTPRNSANGYLPDTNVNRDLLDASGLLYQINNLPTSLLSGLKEAQNNGGGSDQAIMKALQTAIPVVYRSEDLVRVLESGIDKKLTADEKRQVLEFYNAPAGKRIAALERDAVGREAEIKLYGANKKAYAARIPACKELDKLTRTTEMAVDISINFSVAIGAGIVAAAKGGPPPPKN